MISAYLIYRYFSERNIMRFSELKQKEVINCRDGERIGYVCDLILDECTACIKKLIIPGQCRLFGILGKDQEYIIPWNCIRQIGTDIILIDIDISCCLEKCE